VAACEAWRELADHLLEHPIALYTGAGLGVLSERLQAVTLT
jgi:hypothetical protein